MAINPSKVVSNTMGKEMPSRPRSKRVPSRGFQASETTNCSSAVVVSKEKIIHQDRSKAAADQAMAQFRIQCLRLGITAMSRAPITGSSNSSVRVCTFFYCYLMFGRRSADTKKWMQNVTRVGCARYCAGVKTNGHSPENARRYSRHNPAQ